MTTLFSCDDCCCEGGATGAAVDEPLAPAQEVANPAVTGSGKEDEAMKVEPVAQPEEVRKDTEETGADREGPEEEKEEKKEDDVDEADGALDLSEPPLAPSQEGKEPDAAS